MKISQLLLLGMLSLLVACGGGSGTDTGDVSGIDSSGIDSSGIGIDGSGIDCGGNSCNIFAAGSIDAFGSVIVGGVTYSLPQSSPVQACSDRETITSENLALGMYIELSGIKNQDGITGTADQINVCPILCGAVESPPEENSINSSEKLLTILGQTVLVRTAETEFEEGRTFEALGQGDQVCIYGYSLAKELVFGTRVEYQQDEQILFVATIEEIRVGSGQLQMSNDLTVSFDDATETTFTNGSAAVGLRVEVIGSLNGTTVTAASIREDAYPLSLQIQPDQTLIVEGAIDTTPTDNSLSVEGLMVELPDNPVITPPFFNLEEGLQLRIEAQNSSSALLARSIFIKRIEEEGEVIAIDTSNRTMTVELLRFGKAIAFNIHDNTQIIGASNEVLRLDQLIIGDKVDVLLDLKQGQLDQDQQYFATKIDRISQFIGASSVDPVAANIIQTLNIDDILQTDAPITGQSVVLSGTGVLNLTLNSEEQYGRLIATGAMTLAGTLQLNLGFTPTAGDTFQVLSWDTLTAGSQFEDIQLALLPQGLAWDLSNLYTEGEVRVIQMAGDINVSAALWFDSADEGTFSKDDSNLVSAWFDKSGNNNNANRFALGNEATWTESQLNGEPGLVFDGNDRYYEIENSPSLDVNNNYTIIMVVKENETGGGGGGDGIITKYLDRSQKQWGVHFVPGGIVLGKELNSNETTHSVGLDMSPHIVSFSVDNGAVDVASRIFIDGAVSDNSPLSIPLPTDTGQNVYLGTFGGTYTKNDYDLDGTIFEILFFNSELSDSNRQAVESYLGAKYNIAVVR